MTCRAIGSLSCTTNGSHTGQALGYDAFRRLISWQNATSLPSATAAYAYDGAGNRVWQQNASGPGGAQTSTTTTYILGHDEQTTTQPSGQQATITVTRYYPTPGGALRMSVRGYVPKLGLCLVTAHPLTRRTSS